jgi:hypothetical protein
MVNHIKQALETNEPVRKCYMQRETYSVFTEIIGVLHHGSGIIRKRSN